MNRINWKRVVERVAYEVATSGPLSGSATNAIMELFAAIKTLERERDEYKARADSEHRQREALQCQLDSINAAIKEGAEAAAEFARWPEAVEAVRVHYVGDHPVNMALDEIERLATEKGDAT